MRTVLPSVDVRAPGRREPLPYALLAVGGGILLGGLVLAYQLRSTTATELAIAGVMIGLACVIVGNPRRCLLAALLLDIPLEWGKYLLWNQAAGKVGAIAGLNISVTTIALAGLFTLWMFDRPSAAPRLRLRAALPLIVYLGVNAASLLVAQDKTLGMYNLALLAQLLLMFIYVVSTVRTREDIRFVVAVLLAGLLAESALILLIYVAGPNMSFLGLRNRVSPADYGGRVGGTVGSPNGAAAYLCLLLPLAISVLVSNANRQLRRLATAALPLGVLALVVTGSRGGWASFAISTAIIGVWMVRRGLILARTAVLAAVFIAVLSVPLWGTVAQRVGGNDNGAAASRLPLMKLAGEMVSAHPLLGVGVNNVGIDIPQYAGPEFDGQFLYTVHNKYLLVWAEAGIGALLAFVWFLVATLRRGWRTGRARDPTLSPLAVGLSAGIAGQIAHMGVDVFNGKPEVEGLWLAAGLLAAMEMILRRERALQRLPRRGWRAARDFVSTHTEPLTAGSTR